MTASNMEVLAKSKPPISLKQHIDECLLVYESLQKAFARLPVNNYNHFWKVVRLGILFHDLGKTHSEFQKVLQGKHAYWYHQRHELFSVPFIDQLELSRENKMLLKLIIAGHHKDLGTLFQNIDNSYKTGNDSFSFGEDGKLEWNDETEKLNIKFIQTLLGEYGISLKAQSLTLPLHEVKEYIRNPVNSVESNFRELLLAAGALKQCDHSASAGIFKVNILENKHFDFLYNTTWKPYFHQDKASKINGNVILTAPTGSGKTEASLMWLNHQLKQLGQGRAFYILPFTASINAMFERLDKKMQGNNEIVGMVHGKLSEYIESHFGDESYSTQNEKLKQDLKDSFRALVPPLKIATPFQLLKYIFGLKGFEKGIFEMSGGYFIFDEIHAYDPEVSAQIKVLIEFATHYLNVNVCLMTATLPVFLKNEFADAMGLHTDIHAAPIFYDSLKRHKIKVSEGLLSDHFPNIEQQLANGKKVLIVCNTIKQAQKVYNELCCSSKVLLHSAFNGIDRNKKETSLMSDNVKLLVGTQAIEVSLDIDYDIIFTELAPLDALLQRFGRVNRHTDENGKYREPCDCIIFSERNDADKYVYSNEDVIKRTLDSLREIESKNNGEVLERELQYYIDKVYPNWSDKDKESFDRVYTNLKTDVLQNLSPFIYDPHREEDFEKQFDGIKVLPSILRSEYQKLLESNQFIKAESLKVSISKRRFASLITKEGIQRDVSVFQMIRKEEIKELPFYVINRKYDAELGLQIEEESEKLSMHEIL